jgi:hypothetical protein
MIARVCGACPGPGRPGHGHDLDPGMSRDCQTAMVTLGVMVVFSNHRLGPSAELLVSRGVAAELLAEVAAAARPDARARWEHELVAWLERCAAAASDAEVDVSDIAWTPEHFEHQRGFLLAAIRRAETASAHGRALARWGGMIEAHPRELVAVGRRWQWPASAVTT